MIGLAILSVSSLFAVIDPLGCIPFFSGLTSEMDDAQKRRVLRKALAVAFCVLLLFVIAGHLLLDVFGVTVDAFRIAGGVIFFGIGLDMLQSKPRRWRTGLGAAASRDQMESEPDEDDDPSVTPIAIPLLAGPGSITTVMVLTAEGGGGWTSKFVVLGAVVAILLLTGAILFGADIVLRRLGHTGMKIIEKLMGLMITVIAVQLILNGIRPFLAGVLGGGG